MSAGKMSSVCAHIEATVMASCYNQGWNKSLELKADSYLFRFISREQFTPSAASIHIYTK